MALWNCRCGWSGDEPEVQRCQRPIYRVLSEWAFHSYDAPLCPQCGRYFGEAAIRRVEAGE